MVSRLIDELARFGIVLAPETEWDYVNGCRFPKHIIITEEGWRLTGVDMDKLRAEQEERLRAIEDGILQPGEAMTVKKPVSAGMNVAAIRRYSAAVHALLRANNGVSWPNYRSMSESVRWPSVFSVI